MSQLPTSRPNNIIMSAYSGYGPSAWRVLIIGEAVRGLVALAMASNVTDGGRVHCHDLAPIAEGALWI